MQESWRSGSSARLLLKSLAERGPAATCGKQVWSDEIEASDGV